MPNHNQSTDSVISQFYKNVPLIKGNDNDNSLPLVLSDFSSMCIEAVYMVDFLKREFRYVADHDFFLCGHSVEEAMSLGYGFYPKVIHREDMPLLAEMHAVILRRLTSMNDAGNINFFSFTVRIKNEKDYLMTHHKIKPIFVAGRIRYGICLLSSSTVPMQGFLRAYYNDYTGFDEYSLKDRKWRKRTLQLLTNQKKLILKLAKQGIKSANIADSIHISYQALRNAERRIYKKLNVHTMIQAVTFATNHRLIFIPEQYPKNLKHGVLPKIPKIPTQYREQRRPMMPEMLPRIQEAMNSGKSVNSIAKDEDIAESTIRYAIKTGRLKRA